ncbi:IS6 family transposase [Halobacterium sp. KA-6]|uniref:IS6 family transposase n=1 Tax=Halobacterium sp. KA-6 TaxID=2896368 RepID=UPI001E5693E5|nr:IS6 family transposase [Halobacterium sp. KA-6]MCD2203658.1 IS6 family transposase [Halobacterium sp. KA-6]
MEREETPRELMKLGIDLHAADLSLSYTISILDKFGVNRARSTVHNWVQKAGLQPTDGKNSDHVAIDETVFKLNDQRYWLSAAVDPATNLYPHTRLFTTRTQALTEMFLREPREKHHVEEATFLVDGVPWLQPALHRHGLRFRHETHGERNAAERVCKKLKRRTNQFGNHFRRTQPATVETWLQTTAFIQNHSI